MSRRNEYRLPPRDRDRDWDRDRDRDRDGYDNRRQSARYGEHPGLDGSLDDYARGRSSRDDNRDDFRGGRGVRGGGYEENYDRRDRRERGDRGGFDRYPRDRDYRNDRDRERLPARRRTPSPDARPRRYSRSPSSVSSSRRMQQSPPAPPSRKRSPSMLSNHTALPPPLHAPMSIKTAAAAPRPLSSSSSSAGPPLTRSPLEPGEATPTSMSGQPSKQQAVHARDAAEDYVRKRQARRSTSVAASQSRETEGSKGGRSEALQALKTQDDVPQGRLRSPGLRAEAKEPLSSTPSQNAEASRKPEYDREPREIKIKQEQHSMRESDSGQRLPDSDRARPSEGRSSYRPDEWPRDSEREPARHPSHTSAPPRESNRMATDAKLPTGPKADRSGTRPSYDHSHTQSRYNNYNYDRRSETYHGNRQNPLYKSGPARDEMEMRTTGRSNTDNPKSQATSQSQDKPDKQGESAWGDDAGSSQQQQTATSGHDQASRGDQAAVDSKDPWAAQPEQSNNSPWGDQPETKVEASSWGSQPDQPHQGGWGSPANTHSQNTNIPWGENSGPPPPHTNRAYYGVRNDNDSWPADHQKSRHGPRQHGAGGYNSNRQHSISNANTGWPHLPHQDSKAGYSSPANASSHSTETKGRSSPVSSANTPAPHSARSGGNQPYSHGTTQRQASDAWHPKAQNADTTETEKVKEPEPTEEQKKAKARAEELARTHLYRITDLHQAYLEAAAASRKAVRELEMLEAEYEATTLVCAILAKELEKPKEAIQA